MFYEVDRLYEKYLKVWEDVCNIESPTDFKQGVDRVGDYFADMGKSLGMKVERFAQKVSGDVVVITLNPESDKKPICLSGHIDTVFPVGSFGPVLFDDEKIYGPGVCDCKGGVVAGFMAMEALKKSGYTDRPVMLLLQTDEEKGSRPSNKATINYICEKAKDAVAFLNLEGHTKGEICLQRKGIRTVTFNIKGVAAHSSKCATEGSNAILEAAHKIIQIEKIKDADGITCSTNIISGGTTVNTVSDSCSFKVNIRFSTMEQDKYIKKRMQEIADTVFIKGCETTLDMGGIRLPMEYNEKNVKLFNKLNEAFEKCGLPKLKASKRTGGSDAADVTAYGIPCVDSIGAEGYHIHTTSEYAYKKSLAEAAKRIVAFAISIKEN